MRRRGPSWELIIPAGRDRSSGKKRYHYRTVRGTRKEAEAILAAWVHAVETGMDIASGKTTVAEYLDRWLDSKADRVRQGRLKKRTVQEYAFKCRLHIKPVIGQIPLTKLKPQHIEAVYQEAFHKGLGAQSVLHLHRILFQALRQAVRWQLVARNAAESVEPPVVRRRAKEALTAHEAARFLALFEGTELHLPASFALGTGLRLGEVFGLRWTDMNLDQRQLEVRRTLQIDGSFGTPKSEASAGTISLSALAMEALRQQRSRQNRRRLRLSDGWQKLGLVFDRGDGGAVRTQSMSRRFSAISRKGGFPHTFHSLRHAHASLMHAAGNDVKTLSRHMRHSSYQITADLYTHVDMEHERAAVQRFNRFLASYL